MLVPVISDMNQIKQTAAALEQRLLVKSEPTE